MAKSLVDILNQLIQLDYDASLAYTRAIAGVDAQDGDIKRQLEAFRADHERHILELSDVVNVIGGKPSVKGRDFKGLVIEGMTAAQAMLGTDGALVAMRTNEELTNRAYDAALKEELSHEVKAIVERNRDDERRHREWIQQTIERRMEARRGSATT